MARKRIVLAGSSMSGKSVFLKACVDALNEAPASSDAVFAYNTSVHVGVQILSKITKALERLSKLDNEKRDKWEKEGGWVGELGGFKTEAGVGFRRESLILMEVNAQRIKSKGKGFKRGALTFYLSLWDLSGESYDRYLLNDDIGIYMEHPTEEVRKYLKDASSHFRDLAKVLREMPPNPRDRGAVIDNTQLDCLCIHDALKYADGVILLLNKGFVEGETFNRYFIDNLINRMRVPRGLIFKDGTSLPLHIPFAVVFGKDDLYNIDDPFTYVFNEPRLNILAATYRQKRIATKLNFFKTTSFGYGNGDPAHPDIPLHTPLKPEGIREVFDWLLDNM